MKTLTVDENSLIVCLASLFNLSMMFPEPDLSRDEVYKCNIAFLRKTLDDLFKPTNNKQQKLVESLLKEILCKADETLSQFEEDVDLEELEAYVIASIKGKCGPPRIH